MLILIAIPSLKLLYLIDEVVSPRLTIKIVGYQWYWFYEYSDYGDLAFDSYMVDMNEAEGNPRLLSTDNGVKVPWGRR